MLIALLVLIVLAILFPGFTRAVISVAVGLTGAVFWLLLIAIILRVVYVS